jgi:hypothetical protein
MTFYERVSGLEERERLVREIEAWRPRLTTPQAYAQFLEEISVYYKNVRWDVLSEEALQALY